MISCLVLKKVTEVVFADYWVYNVCLQSLCVKNSSGRPPLRPSLKGHIYTLLFLEGRTWGSCHVLMKPDLQNVFQGISGYKEYPSPKENNRKQNLKSKKYLTPKNPKTIITTTKTTTKIKCPLCIIYSIWHAFSSNHEQSREKVPTRTCLDRLKYKHQTPSLSPTSESA